MDRTGESVGPAVGGSITLYELFAATFTTPRPDDTARFEALVSVGMAEIAMQGKIAGYRITPHGYREALRRWGHQQQPRERKCPPNLNN